MKQQFNQIFSILESSLVKNPERFRLNDKAFSGEPNLLQLDQLFCCSIDLDNLKIQDFYVWRSFPGAKEIILETIPNQLFYKLIYELYSWEELYKQSGFKTLIFAGLLTENQFNSITPLCDIEMKKIQSANWGQKVKRTLYDYVRIRNSSSYIATVSFGLQVFYKDEEISYQKFTDILQRQILSFYKEFNIELSIECSPSKIIGVLQNENAVKLNIIQYKTHLSLSDFKKAILTFTKQMLFETNQNRVVVSFNDETKVVERIKDLKYS